MSVASNKPVSYSILILERLGVDLFFDLVAGPETVGALKPDPAMIHACLKAMELPADETLYVGDMTIDADAGLRAGVSVVLVAGGEGKGQDFSPLKDAIARSARALVLIGRDAPLIEAAVAGAGVAVRRASSMEEAVELAARAALPGDAVLLSPACASFDMFRDYRHRGDVFRLAVEKITHAAKH